jgi:hypothetical protein
MKNKKQLLTATLIATLALGGTASALTFNPEAKLDTTQVTDLRSVTTSSVAPSVLVAPVPAGAPIERTPQTKAVGTVAPSPAVEIAEPLVIEKGDDNGDGRIDEDESGWDCANMGNKVCGNVAQAQAEWDAQSEVDKYNNTNAVCPEGYAMAEDYSCVPSTFWDATDY